MHLTQSVRQDANAREQLVFEMLKLVRSAAANIRRKLPPHIELDDLVAAGNVGLFTAFRKFDTGRHVQLASYASHRVRGAILDELRKMDHAPRSMRRQTKRVEQAHRNLEAKLGRAPNDGELARELGISLEEWHQTAWHLEAIAISPPRWPAEPRIRRGEAGESPADSRDDPFEACYRSELRQILGRARASLSKRQQLILAQYYDKFRTMREIGAELGIDESRVSRLHKAALERLRETVTWALYGHAPRSQLSKV